ncbi:MAG: 4Fe-4S dicluster domain-containing protein [Methanobacteriales archaeon]|nr:4Fe-4S dicluster domain-containing protein [Methanobacteriales archaeon]
MSSVIWYLYEFARKSWAESFAGAKTNPEIMEAPDRFRDFPQVIPENCIACGACTAACPAPSAIKLVRSEDNSHEEGITYPVINTRGCIRCGFCAEVCPTDPKTLLCGENHLIREEFTILPVEKTFTIDDYLCIRCKKCMNTCPVEGAITEDENKIIIDKSKCISCGECLKTCPVKGAVKGIFVSNIQEQKQIIQLLVNTLEKRIEDEEENIKQLEGGEVFRVDLSINEFVDQAHNIVTNDELILDIIQKMTDRLKMRIITWDQGKCNDCRLCVADCPSGAITYTKEEGVQRNADKCLRCSVCYQTCPFGVVGYYVARFLLDEPRLEGGVIHITVKASQLPQGAG